MNTKKRVISLSACLFGLLLSLAAYADTDDAPGLRKSKKQQVIDYWTPERMRQAVPRDLVIDEKGNGYLRARDGSLIPYGHTKDIVMNKPPSQTGDNEGPVISDMDPAGVTINSASINFSTTVEDPSGVKSVTFHVVSEDGLYNWEYSAIQNGTTWYTTIDGFTDGNWVWTAIAKDKTVPKGNISEMSAQFTVSGVGSGGSNEAPPTTAPEPVANAEWVIDGDDTGGDIQQAVGRLYFEMPNTENYDPSNNDDWDGYVCSATVINDDNTERSVIITAAHCVYDDVYKAFARFALFIPNQDNTSGNGLDGNCGNDPYGCWVTDFGVVDINWTTRTFPNNIPWDYAYYVIINAGSHTSGLLSDIFDDLALDVAVPAFSVLFDNPVSGDLTHALGYPYDYDPDFRYCADYLETVNLTLGFGPWREVIASRWLDTCNLAGGSSGGLWLQQLDLNYGSRNGSGPIMSVNSWGSTKSSGMGGPFLNGTSASCLFGVANSSTTTDSDGIVVNCN